MTAVGDGSGGGDSTIALDTPAQRRVAESVLDWGGRRPTVDPDLVPALRAALEDGLAPHRAMLRRLAGRQNRGSVALPAWVRDRGVCDGLQLEPEPFVPDRASARGQLTRHALMTAFVTSRRDPPRTTIEDVWQRIAGRTPGDPSSMSAWLNHLDDAERAELCDEVTELIATFREVWPPLPATYVDVDVDRRVEVPLLDGLVRLQGRIDVSLEGRRADERARGLVVVLATGMPRPEEDLARRRSAALLRALTAARPPFRWATYHATEGRVEVEDLAGGGIWSAVQQIVDVAAQLGRLEDVAPGAPESSLRLAPGPWCGFCRRRVTCSRIPA